MDTRVISRDMTDLERTKMMKNLRTSMQSWVFRVEEGDLSGLKLVPPLEILMVPDLIPRAWYKDRLIPWLPGFVEWETYLDYLDAFFACNSDVLLTLDDAIHQYLELENKLVDVRAGVLSAEESSLNERINTRITEIRKQQYHMSHEELCLASASFMCIAAETKMMSELTHNNLSNCVRECALDLMFNNGSRCAAVSAVLLGMTKEATLMVGYMKDGGNPDMEVEVCTCLNVRSRTLALLPILQRSYARVMVSHTVESGSDAPVELVDKSHTNNKKIDDKGTIVPRDGESAGGEHHEKVNDGKKMSSIGKTKALFKSLLLKRKKGSLHRNLQTSEPKKALFKSLLLKRQKESLRRNSPKKT